MTSGSAPDDTSSGTDADAAFAALSDPVRVEIVRVLADRYRESPDNPVLAFSTLRRRVGVDDSGRFLYHLKQLLDVFAEKTADGYQLTEAGHAMAAAIVAGTYTRDETLGPTPLDSVCPLCAETVVGRYVDGSLRVTCLDDHPLFVWSLPPNAVSDASIPDLVAAARLDLSHTVETMLAGFCPGCWSRTTTHVRGLDEEGSLGFTATCDGCGARVVGPVGFALLGHPAVDAFFSRHGSSPAEQFLWELPFVQHDAAVAVPAEDSPLEVASDGEDDEAAAVRVHLSFQLNGETLVVSLDATAHVISTQIRSDAGD